MPFSRRAPILRGVAVAGTAALAGRAAAKHATSQQQQQQQQQPQGQQPAAAPAPAPAAPPDDLTARLGQLADLHSQGALSDAEFTAAKAKLLGTA